MKIYQREQYRYTARFCEENIWWLARSLQAEGIDISLMTVMFICNPDKSVLLLAQRAARPGQALLWDYHVVLHLQDHDRALIFDFDTRLPFPAVARDWFALSFPLQSRLAIKYRAWIRQVPALHLLQHFFSDRSHMRGVVPQSSFPPYAIISPARSVERIPLADYLNMDLPINQCPVSKLTALLAAGTLT